ncbi:PREDICTED: BOI-related E3 ubiquitin-protein ligase 1 [Camelina sativa]|uniref:BOI-related E3 ubiquitin-protein ligase 1 n=1 Tax=Camelina sativa TaxID=90675 RepID=A0ABM0X694_CAMSA|nr:PREDICTED: BOI-related E3 ubiquitin-protein ligase 1 [Camelina sativa]
MAVQAHHHPSTLFFLNRNGQEGNDCSNQPEQKSQFHSINTGVDSRKRAREVSSSVIDLEDITTAAPMNPLPQTPPEVIGRRQNPNVVVSTGLRLSREQNQEQRFSTFPIFTGDLAGEIESQTDELNRFLQIQGEQLRRMLAENNDRHYRELLRTTEESVRRRLREKEAEVDKATRRHAELEARASQIETESRAWQVRAAAREAEATSLQAHLQQAVFEAAHRGGVITTAEQNSGSVDGADEAEDAESAYVDPDRCEMIGPGCRICRRRSATVLALPCRHLVLCQGCDGSVRVCPLCLSTKNSSVEVFYS